MIVITAELAGELAGEVRGSGMSLARQTEVIQAVQTIRLGLEGVGQVQCTSEGATHRRRVTVAAGTLNLYAPWVLDRLFDADPGLARLIMIGEGNHGQRD